LLNAKNAFGATLVFGAYAIPIVDLIFEFELWPVGSEDIITDVF